MGKLTTILLLLSGAMFVGCAPAAGDPSEPGSSADAIESSSGLTVIAIDQPLDFTREQDWARREVDVLQRFDGEDRWVPANKVERPEVSSTIKDGFGSGPCRLRANPFKKEIGFRCRWSF